MKPGSRVRHAVRTWAQRVNKYIPHRAVPAASPDVVACCVYRSVNAHLVAQFAASLPEGADVRLHALDGVVASLSEWTLGEGPGQRMPLLTSLIEQRALPARAWLVLFDDDATFALRGRSPFLKVAKYVGLDIAQPAIDPGQPHSHAVTLTRFASVARRSAFVEVGPVVAFSPRAQRHILPFPAEARMGWGLDIWWSGLAQEQGLTLGIVDATPIRHHGQIATAYPTQAEEELKKQALAALGVADLDLLLHEIPPRWRPWQQHPPWWTPPTP